MEYKQTVELEENTELWKTDKSYLSIKVSAAADTLKHMCINVRRDIIKSILMHRCVKL